MTRFAPLFLALGFALPVEAACPRDVQPADEQILFTFNALVDAASFTANAQQFDALRQFLLVYQSNDHVDAALPIRAGVASSVQNWPESFRRRALSFFLLHKAAATNYNALVLQMVGPPPLFTTYDQEVPGGTNEQDVYRHRDELAELLRQAWGTQRASELWKQWQPAWQRSQICTQHLLQVRQRVTHYLRVNEPDLASTSVVIDNPLMPVGSGVTSVYADGHFVMLIGPTRSALDEDLLIAHELTHPIFSRLFQSDLRLRAALGASACVFTAISHDAQSGILTRYVYNTWESYFAESMVRTVSHRVVALPDPGFGFTLSSYLAGEMQQFEDSNRTFSQSATQILNTLRRDYCYGPAQASHVLTAGHHRDRWSNTPTQ